MRKKEPKSIDVTPTWQSIIPILIDVLRNPKANPDSVREITSELMRLAKFADKEIAAKKSTQ